MNLTSARKRHSCRLCPLPILTGTQYYYERLGPHTHPGNDVFSDWRAHPRCEHVYQDRFGEASDWYESMGSDPFAPWDWLTEFLGVESCCGVGMDARPTDGGSFVDPYADRVVCDPGNGGCGRVLLTVADLEQLEGEAA